MTTDPPSPSLAARVALGWPGRPFPAPAFAAWLGVTPGTVRAWERGEKMSGLARSLLGQVLDDPTRFRAGMTNVFVPKGEG